MSRKSKHDAILQERPQNWSWCRFQTGFCIRLNDVRGNEMLSTSIFSKLVLMTVLKGLRSRLQTGFEALERPSWECRRSKRNLVWKCVFKTGLEDISTTGNEVCFNSCLEIIRKTMCGRNQSKRNLICKGVLNICLGDVFKKDLIASFKVSKLHEDAVRV